MASRSRKNPQWRIFRKIQFNIRLLGILYRYRMGRKGCFWLDFSCLDLRIGCEEGRNTFIARRNDLRTKILHCIKLEISYLGCAKSETLNILSELLTELALVRGVPSLKIINCNMLISNNIQIKKSGMACAFSNWHMPCV
jgi:hypothetical protein